MIEDFKKVNRILSFKERKKLIYLSVLKFFSGFMDMIGVASVAPFIAVITNKKILNQNEIVLKIKDILDFNNQEIIILFALASLFLIIFNQLIRILNVWYDSYVSHNIWLSFHTQLFKFYLNQSYSFHLSRSSNRLLEKILVQTNAAVAGFITPFFQILGNIFTFCFLLLFLTIADPFIALVLVIVTGLFYVGIFSALISKISSYGKFGPVFSRKTFKLVDQAFRSIKDIKVKKNAKFYVDLFNPIAKKYVNNSINLQFFTSFPRSTLEIFAYTFGFSVIIYFILGQDKEFGEIAVLLGIYVIALQRVLPAAQGIYQQISNIKYHKANLQSVYDDLVLATSESGNSSFQSLENKNFNFSKKIEFKNVKFKYPNSSKIVLTIDDLNIKAGSFVGITGQTGSGKSTFIDLMIGLLNPTFGKIIIDGKNLDNNFLEKWLSNIGYVPQF